MPETPNAPKRIKSVIDKCYIKSLAELQDEKNRLVAHCRIVDIYENTLELAQTSREALGPGLPFGMAVKINIFNTRYGMKILTGIYKGYADGIIKIVGADVIQGDERREFFRVPTFEAGVLRRVLPKTELTTGKLGEGGSIQPAPKGGGMARGINIVVENLSLNGLLFYAEESFREGDRITIDSAPLNQRMRFVCEVVRIIPDSEGKEHYGCRMLNMSDYSANDLSRLLMKLQQSNRARLRDGQ